MNLSKTISYFCFVVTLSGCSTVTQEQINTSAKEMRERINAQTQAQANAPMRPLVERMTGSYLGSTTVPLAYSASLPAIFRDSDVTLNFPARSNVHGKVNLSTIAARITEVTKLPVRIRPDVFVTAKSLVRAGTGTSSGSNSSSGSNQVEGGMPFPTSSAPVGGNTAVSPQLFADYDANLPMEYSGSLAGYLDFICARLGINWEYKDGGITLYRFVSKTFVIKVNPGDIKFASSLAKGDGASPASGGTGGIAGSTTGTFTSDTSSSINADFSIWKSMQSAINGMISSFGHVTVDQAAGLIIVTDTKDVVDTVARYVEVVNNTLTRQIDLEVRILQVSTTDTNEQGLDVSLLYSRLNAAGGIDKQFSLSSPSDLASTAAGKIGFSVLTPSSPWGGSSVVVKALNELGTVVSDNSRTATTTNRVPVPIANFETTTYLASTTPASAGVVGATGSGIPGLTPGQITVGSFLNVLPTAFENGSVLLRLSFDDTSLKDIGDISSGEGPTFQQIQTPNYFGSKSDHSVGLKDGESLVLMGATTDKMNGTNRNAITGISVKGNRIRTTQVIIVTPRVRAGI